MTTSGTSTRFSSSAQRADHVGSSAASPSAWVPWGGRITGWLAARLEKPSPLVKQLPVTCLFVLALVISFSDGLVPTVDFGLLAIATVIMGASTGLAALVTARAWSPGLANVVLGIDFLAAMALRHATGDAKSLFSSIVLIPTLWMASNVGRRYVVYAICGVGAVYTFPFLLPGGLAADPNGPARALYIVLAYSLGAVVTNELARQARRQFDVTRAQEQAFENEIMLGGVVQQALLPKVVSAVPGYEVSGACIPARMVGGDFYDWYPTADGMGFTLGDVMGKGVGAGIIAATARAVIRSARDEEDPVVALARTDACLSTELGDVDSFATVFHARLDAEHGRVRYSDAGHGLTLHVRARGGWTRLTSSGLPVGVGLGGGWDFDELTMEPGDLLVSFSDGVLDFYDGSLSAMDHLALIARDVGSADELVESIKRLATRVEHDDDVTVVVLRRSAELAPAV